MVWGPGRVLVRTWRGFEVELIRLGRGEREGGGAALQPGRHARTMWTQRGAAHEGWALVCLVWWAAGAEVTASHS